MAANEPPQVVITLVIMLGGSLAALAGVNAERRVQSSMNTALNGKNTVANLTKLKTKAMTEL